MINRKDNRAKNFSIKRIESSFFRFYDTSTYFKSYSKVIPPRTISPLSLNVQACIGVVHARLGFSMSLSLSLSSPVREIYR